MDYSGSLSKLFRATLFAGLLFALAACEGQAQEAGATPTPVLQIPSNELVYVPAGSFYMGSNPELDPLARPDEFPLHPVRLDGFFIYRNEVTNDMYAQCVAAGKCSPPNVIPDGPSTHYGEEAFMGNPVVGVNWDQAVAFCTWVDSRLPTEAEWEKAARGLFANTYPWGGDQPSCDFSNMEGCTQNPPNTEIVGQHPSGESFYEANDMSGNVWEWTADTFNPDYYRLSPNINPLGPDNGDLKVVRGGSFMTGPADLRAAARKGLDPKMAFNDVGFRCVPIGLSSPAAAPFCKSAYVPFCNDPGNPGDCNPNANGQPENGQGPNFDFLGFSCPEDGFIKFTIDAGGPAADNYTVDINGIPYNCVDSTQIPGRLICEGTAQSQNTLVNVTVCPKPSAGAGGSQLMAVNPSQSAPDAKLVSFKPAQSPSADLVAYIPPQQAQPKLQAFTAPNAGAPQLLAFQSATNGYCPQGMFYNPDTQQCETDPNGDACPDGWTYNPDTYKCEPGETGCPQGTTYNPDKQACTPDNDGECPSPYVYDQATQTCQPPSNDDGGGQCPAGYFYDQSILCCSPIRGDNNGCQQGTYFSVDTGQCQPLDGSGCPQGMTYNPYEGGCFPDTSNGGDGQTSNACPQEGYVMNAQGVCVPVTGPTAGQDCGPNAYYDTYIGQCVGVDENQCGPGYFYDANMQTCRPTDGPGSPCANGYAFNQRLNCCVPTPGNDGSSCPGDPQGGQALTAFPAPSNTNYDYGQGYCDPGNNGQCPGGYYFNTDSNSCQPVPTSPTEPNSDNQCPEGYVYDPAYDTCVGTNLDSPYVECGQGQYFDYDLGYCVQAGCEGGCALGFYFNTDTKTCQPLGQQGCITFTESVPVCGFTPEPTPVCDEGTTYVPSTGQCERNPAEQPGCSQYTDSKSCGTAGCTWNTTRTPPNYGYCSN